MTGCNNNLSMRFVRLFGGIFFAVLFLSGIVLAYGGDSKGLAPDQDNSLSQNEGTPKSEDVNSILIWFKTDNFFVKLQS